MEEFAEGGVGPRLHWPPLGPGLAEGGQVALSAAALWSPASRAEVSEGDNDWNFPSRFALTTYIELPSLVLYHVSKNGIH